MLLNQGYKKSKKNFNFKTTVILSIKLIMTTLRTLTRFVDDVSKIKNSFRNKGFMPTS